MARTQEAINILLGALSDIIPLPKADVYKEFINFIKDLSNEVEAGKKEIANLQKQLEKIKK